MARSGGLRTSHELFADCSTGRSWRTRTPVSAPRDPTVRGQWGSSPYKRPRPAGRQRGNKGENTLAGVRRAGRRTNPKRRQPDPLAAPHGPEAQRPPKAWSDLRLIHEPERPRLDNRRTDPPVQANGPRLPVGRCAAPIRCGTSSTLRPVLRARTMLLKSPTTATDWCTVVVAVNRGIPDSSRRATP